jgi:GH25 family lysozyme M1 (1,4-beta-N-acetylmuramidase)
LEEGLADTLIAGIDVSHDNGVIDWPRVPGLGVTFAFAKATQGADPSKPWYTDKMFATNWPAMQDAGIIRGAYHFIGLPLTTTPKGQWNDDLHRQIDHFLATVGPLGPNDLPPVLDLENGDSPQRWRQLIQSDREGALGIVRELIQYTTEQLDPVKPILYTGSFWWSDLGDPDADADGMPFGDYVLWFAQYPSVHTPGALPRSSGATDQGEASSFDEYSATPSLSSGLPKHIPKVWGGPANPRWNIWQFSSFGSLAPAVTGFVDLDVFNGNLDQLNALTAGAVSPGNTPIT